MRSCAAPGRGLWALAWRALSAGLAAGAARLSLASLVRRRGWANSPRCAALRHAQPTAPRLPSVALGGLNGPATPRPTDPGPALTPSQFPNFREHHVPTI